MSRSHDDTKNTKRSVFGTLVRLLAGIASVALVLQTAVTAQLAFDVASIKESQSLDAGGSLRLMPGGGLTARHIPVRTLINVAYHLQPFQVVDAPQWTRERYYDVTARPAGAATREQTFLMLQALLTDRFKLAFHRENRQLDGFALVRAGTGPLGPGLRATSVDCGARATIAPQCRDGEITSSSMRAFGVPIWSVLQLVISEVGAASPRQR